jgi:hypothetical protein
MELKFSGTCNYSSTWKTVKCGVPQESESVPLLFNINNNDLLGSIDKSSNVIMYANYTSILISNSCYEELNRNREFLRKWFKKLVILCVPSWCIDSLTLYLLMWRIC